MLQLQYQARTNAPVEVAGLLPERLRELPLDEIERLPVQHGNQTAPLAEFFRVAGDPADMRLEISGELAGVHRIGAGMTAGEIHVAGTAGRHTGAEMRGGKLRVAGDVGDWVGAEMHGGTLHVEGRAGHHAGAAYHGSPRGMTGGILMIRGDAGDETGHSMRRGLVAVGGSCGEFAAINMIAGTVLVLGDCGIRPGAGMRRGTLVVAGKAARLLPTFRAEGAARLLFLRVYLLTLRRHGFPVPDELLEAEFTAHAGDLLTVGRGEILIRNG